jgi:lipopolysaccharide export system protein LptC
MTLARTDTLDQRSEILQRLISRNRVIGVLRILVPAAGVAAFVVLAAEIYVTNTLRQFGVSGIRIDRGALVVDAPQYSAVGASGAHYTASAKEARAPIANTRLIAMDAAVLTLEQPGHPTMHLTAPIANADTEKQIFSVPGTATFTDSAGLHGTLAQLEADVGSGIIVARGPVAMAFPNGATLNAASMRYDSTAQTMTLARVTFTAPGLPDASP